MYSDNLQGHGDKRFIEVSFRKFPAGSYGYSSSKPQQEVNVFGSGKGRLSLYTPGEKATPGVKKQVLSIFIDIESPSDIEEYMSDELKIAFFDREHQELITSEELSEIMNQNEQVTDSSVAYIVQ
tara:strand:+ start:75 stop:449 length:375 start_codon:yes stop_codon:yes gene_type:complete